MHYLPTGHTTHRYGWRSELEERTERFPVMVLGALRLFYLMLMAPEQGLGGGGELTGWPYPQDVDPAPEQRVTTKSNTAS